MAKVLRFFVLLVFVVFIGISTSSAENAELKLERMFSYDPHPGSAFFAEQVPFNGKMHDFEIVFIENWQVKGENGTLKQIAFKIQAVDGGKVVASSETIPVTAAKISKGQQIGNVKVGEVSFSANVTEIVKNKSGITDLTVSFTLTYDKNAAETAAKPADNLSVSGLDFARQLASRASAMPQDKPAAKISMYKRALMAAPAAETSAEAAAFHKEIGDVISGLEKSSPSFVPFKKTEPAFVTTHPTEETAVSEPADAAPVASPVEKPAAVTRTDIPDEAVALYKEARSMFAQNKGPEGREVLRKALEIAPAYHDALLLLGDNATEYRRWARAKDAYKQALDQRDRDADTLLKYFKSCYYIGEGADAIVYLEQVRNKYPTERRIQLAVAEANFQLGDLPAAKALCEEMLLKDPEDSRASDLLQRVNRLHK
jgi:tetratricopeptide (TPR) repeat protein